MVRAARPVALTLLVVLAGCAGFAGAPGVGPSDRTSPGPATGPDDLDSNSTTPAPLTPPPDAAVDNSERATVVEEGGGDGGGGASGATGGDGAAGGQSMTAAPAMTPAADSAKVGYSVGGAQDATAFRRNVREGYVPQPTDVTYEGLFHDYYFETGATGECAQLFCPAYSRAVTDDPLSNTTERYLTVGLNSNITEEAFERKPLDLVVVLDTSGSMESSFDEYYYDGGTRREVESNQRKMRAATDAVASMTTHLEEGDRLGVVTYSSRARVFQEMTAVGDLDREGFRSRLARVRAQGSTNLDAGMRTARSLLGPDGSANATERETRIVYVTDAMPNTGQTGAGSLQSRLGDMAEENIYSTFVGVGVDFNTELIEAVTSTRGANYYTVHSPNEFDERMDEGFEYMVTPLVFDLNLTVDAAGYEIRNVFGTTDEAASTGRVLHVKTLFPSQSEGGKTKGGVVLLQLAKTGDSPELTLSASYENRAGESFHSNRSITFADHDAPYFESSGVRKAVALQRYATLLRNWAAFERSQVYGVTPPEPDTPDDDIYVRELGTWEQRSVALRVSELYRERFARFQSSFEAQIDALGDESMDRDLGILENLSAASGEPVTVHSPGDGPTSHTPVSG
ncbi:MAG: VWA domain-containing protein [Haloarculaceae archaeon]